VVANPRNKSPPPLNADAILASSLCPSTFGSESSPPARGLLDCISDSENFIEICLCYSLSLDDSKDSEFDVAKFRALVNGEDVQRYGSVMVAIGRI
jgi:hypothetical protein